MPTTQPPRMSRPQLLFGGLYLAYKIFREIVRRITGVPAGAPFTASVFAVGVVANALRPFLAPVFRALRPRSPSRADAVWAIAVPSAIIQSTGVSAKDTPLVGAAIGLGLVAPAFGDIAALARMLRAAFAAVGRAGQPRRNSPALGRR